MTASPTSAPQSPEASETVGQERTMTCPTCGAQQATSDVCRRCQSDLQMVCDVQRQVDEHRRRCLALLKDRRLKRATLTAHRCRELSHDEHSARLLATSYLMQGDFAAALRIYCESAAASEG